MFDRIATEKSPMLLRGVADCYDSAHHTYEHHAIVQKWVGHLLCQQLPLTANAILDCGAGTGYFTRQLKQYFPNATLMSIDLSRNMLLHHTGFVAQADQSQLPFSPATFDMVFANMVFHWSTSLPTLLHEIKQALKPGGCLLFSLPTTHTLHELKTCWSFIDHHAHVNTFYSQDYIQKMAEEAGFQITLHSETFVLYFDSVPDILRHLKNTGSHFVAHRPTGLMGKQQFDRLRRLYEQYRRGQLPCTYEIMYGKALLHHRY